MHVIQMLKVGSELYSKPPGLKRYVNYIALELAEGGELFDCIDMSGVFDERLARYYFK